MQIELAAGYLIKTIDLAHFPSVHGCGPPTPRNHSLDPPIRDQLEVHAIISFYL